MLQKEHKQNLCRQSIQQQSFQSLESTIPNTHSSITVGELCRQIHATCLYLSMDWRLYLGLTCILAEFRPPTTLSHSLRFDQVGSRSCCRKLNSVAEIVDKGSLCVCINVFAGLDQDSHTSESKKRQPEWHHKHGTGIPGSQWGI